MCVVEQNLKVSLSTINHRLYFTHKMKTAILKTRFHPNILQQTEVFLHVFMPQLFEFYLQ